MTLQPWTKLGDETLARHLVFHVRRSRQRSPRTGVEIPFFLIDTANWVNILPITEDGEIVFVRQWRHGSERRWTTAAPALRTLLLLRQCATVDSCHARGAQRL